MFKQPRPIIHVAPQYQPIFRELGLDAESIFNHPQIKPWRTLDDRENCTLDATLADGLQIHWHVKRYKGARGLNTPADLEMSGHRALGLHNVPTANLIAWGKLPDRRSVIIFEDLADYTAADKLIKSGISFD